MGGKPFQDGDEPDSDSHGAADEEFATVVFDEDFVRSAEIHEPSAVERMLAAAQARAEAEAARRRPGASVSDEELYEAYGGPGEWYDPDDDGHDPYGPYGGALRPYRSGTRWHRPVAWVLAIVMGVGMVALAFAAVYRGDAGSRQDPSPPPATTGVDDDRAERSAGLPEPLPYALAGGAAPAAVAVPYAR